MLFACNDIENTSFCFENIQFIRRGDTDYNMNVVFKDGKSIVVKYDAVDDCDKDFARFRRGILKFNALNFSI